MYKIDIETTKKQQIIEITEYISKVINESKVKNGVCFVYSPHTTCGISLNEGADPDVKEDLINKLNDIIPVDDRKYRHIEGNSHSHIKTVVVGSSVTIFIENGKLLLGRWQSVYLCEFDGPRRRNVWVKILSEDKI